MSHFSKVSESTEFLLDLVPVLGKEDSGFYFKISQVFFFFLPLPSTSPRETEEEAVVVWEEMSDKCFVIKLIIDKINQI